jgi:hypothetical protein
MRSQSIRQFGSLDALVNMLAPVGAQSAEQALIDESNLDADVVAEISLTGGHFA